MFIDTHCHLNMMVNKKYDQPLNEEQFSQIGTIVQEAHDAGVSNIINIGTDLRESINSIEIAKRFDNVFSTVGLHPCDCIAQWKKDFQGIKKLLEEKEANKIVGVGEVGLDFYHKPYDEERQRDAFKAHINLALKKKLALVIHVRDAGDELLKVLEPYAKDLSGKAVIHCFCQPEDFAKIVVNWGFYLGIDAPITYPKNESLRTVVRNVPLDNIILETDSPFLPPQQFRGKQNRPSYIPLFAPIIAELKNISVEEVAAATTKNAKKLFNF